MIDGTDESLEGEDLLVELTDPHGNKTYPSFDEKDNVVTFLQYGTDQRLLGVYSCRLWLNKGKDGQCLLDIPHIFELVSTTDEERLCPQSDLEYSVRVMSIKHNNAVSIKDDGSTICIKNAGYADDGDYIELIN